MENPQRQILKSKIDHILSKEYDINQYIHIDQSNSTCVTFCEEHTFLFFFN